MLRFALPLALLATAPATAQDWIVDHDTSSVGFVTEAFGGSVEGSFESWSADITLDPADPASGSIAATVQTATGSTGNGQMDESMLGSTGLGPDSFAEARFISTDIRATDAGFEAHGVLTIRDAEQPVVLPFTLDITDGGRAVADAELEIIRSEYGVGDGSWGQIAMNVTLVLHIEADAAE